MKIILSFFFVLVLILPFIGVWHLRYEIKQVKREMKFRLLNHIEKENIIILKISKQDLLQGKQCQYYREDREIDINHHMYDIISMYEDNGYYMIKCIADEKESVLKKQINYLLRDYFSHHNPFNKQAKKIVDFFQTLYLQPISVFNFISSKVQYFRFEIGYKFSYEYLYVKRIQTPPKG